jgi:hypothetical protein
VGHHLGWLPTVVLILKHLSLFVAMKLSLQVALRNTVFKSRKEY